jgi:hypothetical protein
MQRSAVSLILGLHGLIHLIGFLSAWRLVSLRDFPYTTVGVWGHLDLGDRGARLLGLAWLLAALLFLVGAVAIWTQDPWATHLIGGAAALSLLLCILGSPSATPGIAINVLILLEVLYRQAAGSTVGAAG